MNLKKTISFLTLLSVLVFAPFFSFAQNNEGNELTKAIQLFDKGNFDEAEKIFKKVLDEKPKDFMVNYFYGACRTQNNHFTNADLDCLILANQEVSPIDIEYYFGIQYHARSNWERALKFYNKYKASATLSETESQAISEKIQQCYDKINPYEEFIVKENDTIIPIIAINEDSINTNIISTDTIKPDSINVESVPWTELIPADSISSEFDSTSSIIDTMALWESLNNETKTKVEIPIGSAISFQINNEITYLHTSNFKTEEGLRLFEEGNQKQKELNTSLKRIDELRQKYNDAQFLEERKIIGQEILSLENNLYSLKKEASQLLFQAKTVENEYWKNARIEETQNFIQEINQVSQAVRTEEELDTNAAIDPDILLGNTDNSPVTEEKAVEDLVYKIQIGAHSRGVPSHLKKLYDKLSFIRKIDNYTDENGVVVYTTGNLANYDDAVKMQNQVKQEGVEAAKVVPYFKGKRITLEQAKELEAEK